MMTANILIAVDGSEQSMNAVHYASRILGPQKTTIDLLHVKPPVPEAVMDLTSLGQTQGFESPIEKWGTREFEKISGFMDEAKYIFVQAGFPSEAVHQTIQPRKSGIARDIISRTLQGYTAVLIGRNGYGSLAETILGGVAAKIVERVVHLPVAVIGGRPDHGKVLIAFDRSRAIRRGIEVLSGIISTEVREITICHIVRPLELGRSPDRHLFSPKHESSWLDENTQKIIPGIVEAKKFLTRQGFAADKFYTPILKEKTSRADGIMGEARSMNIGTIVVGRHGLTDVADFTMGRVTRKLLHMATAQALWIV